MQVCTYIVTEDSGFAPNPFGKWCTLAACTPNHMNARLDKGDWIVGFLSKSRQNRFLFAMEILCVMQMGDYFTDPRFESKKPKKSPDWRERCGDNIYEQLGDGTWVQHTNDFHNTKAQMDQDTKYAKVFVASRFWYFGQESQVVPAQFAPVIPDRTEYDATTIHIFQNSLCVGWRGFHAASRPSQMTFARLILFS